MVTGTDVGQPIREGDSVIDVDVHLEPSVEEVSEFCEEPHRRRLRNSSAYPKAPGSDWMQPKDRLDPEVLLTRPERVQRLVCDEWGIDRPILNLNTGIQKLPEVEFAVHLMEAYNDYLLDRFLDDSGFHGLAEITTQDPGAAAEELDRMGSEERIVGALIASTGPEKPLGDPRYDVLYRAAEDNGLPIAFHPLSGPHFRHDFPKQNQGVTNSLGVESLGSLWSQTLTLSSLIVQGVPEKFPNLDFVFLETGPTWVPYMMWRLNKEYSIQKVEAPLLTQSPEQYIRDSIYFAGQARDSPKDPTQLRPFVDAVGAESLLFSANYPYPEVGDVDQLTESLRDVFDSDELEQVFRGTAAEIFGIDG